MKYQQPLSIAIFSILFRERASPCGDTAIKQEFLWISEFHGCRSNGETGNLEANFSRQGKHNNFT